MLKVVKTYRAIFVEGRFMPLMGVLGFLVMRTILFLHGDPYHVSVPTNNYLWNPLSHFFVDPWTSYLASTVSILLIAWALSMINGQFNLIRARTNLPFVMPLFLFSLHPCFLVMTGDYIAILFILLAFFPLLESYQKSDSYLFSFRSAILIGLASLFQLFSLLILPVWWRGEHSMRGSQSRSFTASLFGLFLVYISLFSIYFLMGNAVGFVEPFQQFGSLSIPIVHSFSIGAWSGFTFVAIFFITNMVLAAKIYSRDKVLTLIFMRFVVFLITILMLLLVVYSEQPLFFLLFSVSLVSCLNAYLYTRTQAKGPIYLAYGWFVLMLLFYLAHFSPFSNFL